MLSVENNTLKKCNSSTIGEVIIPDGINKIDSSAFSKCKNITSVTIPASVEDIGYYTFEGCDKLKKVYIYGNIEYVGGKCFEGCIKLEEVLLPNTLKRIEYNAFKGCVNLSRIQIPVSVNKISDSCFEGCTSLQEIKLPYSLNHIGDNAFRGVELISEISIPKSTTYIGESAFENCTSLGVVKILSERIEIASTAFKNCIAITKLYLKNFNECLVLSAFGDCNLLNSIIPLDENNNAIIKQITPKSKIQKSLSDVLKYMSMYYHNLGMNITQMNWESLKNKSSFKAPIDTNWTKYKQCAQDLSYILSMDWNNSKGIGLVLGHNQYRALDVDGVDIHNKYRFSCCGKDALDIVINKFLDLLKLPNNYPWVVYSGSGNGFHIIFKSEDFGDNIDSISFEPNNDFSYYNDSYFKRIELRWCDHLVLPPSVHASGNKYQFREEGLPSELPASIHLTEIDRLINYYCGEVSITPYETKNGHHLEIAEFRKIISRHDSYLKHQHYEISGNWLRHSNLEENKVSLAIKYIIGDEVQANFYEAHNILEKCNSKNAIFNLLTLYSVGFCLCEFEKIENLLKQLSNKDFPEESIELIKENAYKYIYNRKKILFFDTETTGLPNDYHAPITNIQNWPRIVQIAWIMTDEEGNVFKKRNYLIEPDDFLIPEEATAIHGITTDYAWQHGISLKSALEEFMSDLNSSEIIVGHNIDYDINTVGAELYRLNMEYNALITKNKICTMKKSIYHCAIPNPNPYYGGFKWPTLQELYKKLFDRSFEDAHDAFSDIIATKECYFELKKLKKL